MSDAAEQHVQVELLKPGKGQVITYQGVLLRATPQSMRILARWNRPPLDLGYMQFDTGDLFYEVFYSDRWYNVFDIRSSAGIRKGWYCNVTRPAHLTATSIRSEDLELDLFVSADRTRLLALDEDEFEARGFAQSAPDVYSAARAALHEMMQCARAGTEPFSDELA